MKFRLVALLAVAALLFSVNAFAQTANTDKDKSIAEITQLENDSVKADLANDSSWYEKNLADDCVMSHSYGTADDKQATLAAMKDTTKNKMNSRSISNLKVRVYGNTAIATYDDTYDGIVDGKPLARTVLSTDTWVKQDGMWKMVASHASVKAQAEAMTH